MLITSEYADLNRLMHETDHRYGTGSWRWAQEVMDLRDDHKAVTVLDYGCGKGRLKDALGKPEWFFEYDPAVPGKDAKPVAADLLVCTDVLEHIEPDLLDNVLKEMTKLCKRAALLVIATRPAKASLPDGTNTHKIVESPDWWRQRLEKYFFIASYEPTGDELKLIVSPIRRVGQIFSKSAVSETIRYEQALRNCSVVPGRVGKERRYEPPHSRRVCIVAYGPSLQHTWRTLPTERRAFGAAIVSVSGAHDFLIERGIVPDYHVEVDPREHKAWFTRNSHPDVNYWIASCCHPKLIDNLVNNNRKVALWHVYNSETDWKIVEHDGPDPGGWLICGGGSVGCRAVNIMYSQGYRSFSVYGMDCSFDGDGVQHAGEHSGKRQVEWNLNIGDRWFRSSANLLYTARGFIDNFRFLQKASAANNEPFLDGTSDRVEFFLHGDGLLQAMARDFERQAAA
jgi:hypothetical protein